MTLDGACAYPEPGGDLGIGKPAGDKIGDESVAVALEMYARLKDGMKDRGLSTKIGAHVLPINDDRLGNAIVEGVAKL